MAIIGEALDFDRIAAAPVIDEPYPHAVIEHSIRPAIAKALVETLPKVHETGSLRLHQVEHSPALKALIADLESDRYRKLMEQKFGLDLGGLEIFTTYRGMMRKEDGVIHTDTPAKTMTTLVYLNPPGSADDASLRLLRSPHGLDDYFAEVPPHIGSMVLFKVTGNCWHGHKSMVGPRHSLQMNYLSGIEMKGHERTRRRLQKWKRKLLG
jgi:SM-20-related protein